MFLKTHFPNTPTKMYVIAIASTTNNDKKKFTINSSVNVFNLLSLIHVASIFARLFGYVAIVMKTYPTSAISTAAQSDTISLLPNN